MCLSVTTVPPLCPRSLLTLQCSPTVWQCRCSLCPLCLSVRRLCCAGQCIAMAPCPPSHTQPVPTVSMSAWVRVSQPHTHTHTHIQLIHDSGLSDLLSPSPTKSPLCLPDTTMPRVCQLQSLFLSHNYLTSDLQPQEVQGCAPVGGGDPEVHVIKLHSAESGLCG